MSETTALSGAVAREIDRIVVRGHELAGAYVPKAGAGVPPAAQPALLNTMAIVLLARPITGDDVGRVLTYTPPSFIDTIVADNIAHDVVLETAGELRLTDAGRKAAAEVVEVQEAVVDAAWADVAAPLETVVTMAGTLVGHACSLPPADEPPAFPLFVGVDERPTPAGRALRLVTAMRYWRADAHRRALREAGLKPGEAHALNLLWDAARGVERVGQGFPEPGKRSVAALEARGLATAGAITEEGVVLRERIEADSNERTAPMYTPLDELSRDHFLAALRALPT